MTSSQRTLVFLLNESSRMILLGQKKRGFGEGKIVGIGGKVEKGETTKAAARREAFEEIGVSIDQEDLRERGTIYFKFPSKPSWNQDVHLFTAITWTGTATESSEINPSWVPFDNIPYPKMWDDARYWLPKLLQGETLRAEIVFAEDLETVKSVDWNP